MSVVAVGLNHRTVALPVLERMTVSSERLPKALADLCSRDHVNEAVVLSTCMRTEVYLVAEGFHGALSDVRNFLCELGHVAPEDFADSLYSYYADAAVAHLFKVAAGLDSAVVGETQILGQVRDAWERARAEGAAGPALSGLFRSALEVGKRVRTETGIARGTTSVSQAAVQLASERLGGLGGRRILVLGAGETGEGMAVALAAGSSGAAVAAGPGGGRRGGAVEVLVANRTRARAAALAARVGGRAVGFGELASALEEVDVLLTATGSESVLVEAADLEAVMAARSGRPLLVVDVAVPRDVDPAAGRIDGVTLLDMDDLRRFAEAAKDGRRREIARVQEILAEEVERYRASSAERSAAPTVGAFRRQAEAVRQAELERFRGRLAGLDPHQREVVEALTRGIVGKLLHEPTVRLKAAAGTPRGERLAESLQVLFDL